MIGSIFNFIGYYVVGIPCFFIFGYALGLQVPGVWIGFNFALFSICIGDGIFIYRLNWTQESAKARIRSETTVQKNAIPTFVIDDSLNDEEIPNIELKLVQNSNGIN